MIDPATIAAPPTPTATSTAQEWANYMSYTRTMAEFSLADGAKAQAAATLDMAAANRELAEAMKSPVIEGVSEATLIDIVGKLVSIISKP